MDSKPMVIGNVTVVKITSRVVETVSRPIFTTLCPAFMNTAVVTARARNTSALSPSVDRTSAVSAGQSPPCQLGNSIP